MAVGTGPKLPLSLNSEDGAYKLLKGLQDTAAQNIKAVILTNPGERVMEPDFGVGIKRFLFELSDENIGTQQQVQQLIRDQISKYLPYVRINTLNVSSPNVEPNTLAVKINYSIPIARSSAQTIDIKVSK